jgi:hypothetical protein
MKIRVKNILEMLTVTSLINRLSNEMLCLIEMNISLLVAAEKLFTNTNFIIYFFIHAYNFLAGISCLSCKHSNRFIKKMQIRNFLAIK